MKYDNYSQAAKEVTNIGEVVDSAKNWKEIEQAFKDNNQETYWQSLNEDYKFTESKNFDTDRDDLFHILSNQLLHCLKQVNYFEFETSVPSILEQVQPHTYNEYNQAADIVKNTKDKDILKTKFTDINMSDVFNALITQPLLNDDDWDWQRYMMSDVLTELADLQKDKASIKS